MAPLVWTLQEPQRFINALSKFIAGDGNYAKIFGWSNEADHLMQATGVYGSADLGIHQLAAIDLFNEELFFFFKLFFEPLSLTGSQYVNQFMAANLQNALYYQFYLTEKNDVKYSLPLWSDLSSSLDPNPYQTLIKKSRNLDALISIAGEQQTIQFRNEGELKGLHGFMNLEITQNSYQFTLVPLSKVKKVLGNRVSISMSNPTINDGIGAISVRHPAYATEYHPKEDRGPTKGVGLDDVMLLTYQAELSPGVFTPHFDVIHGNEHLDKVGIRHKGYIFQKQNDRFAILSHGGTQSDTVWNMQQQIWYLCHPFPSQELYYRNSDNQIQSIQQIIGIHSPLLTIQQRQQMGILFGRSDLLLDGIPTIRLRFKSIMLNLHRIVAQNLVKLTGFYPQEFSRALHYANTIQEMFGISAPTMAPGTIPPQLSIIRKVPLLGYDDAGNSRPLPNSNLIPLIDRKFVLNMQQYWYNIAHASDATILAEFLPYSLGTYMKEYPNLQQMTYKKYFLL